MITLQLTRQVLALRCCAHTVQSLHINATLIITWFVSQSLHFRFEINSVQNRDVPLRLMINQSAGDSHPPAVCSRNYCFAFSAYSTPHSESPTSSGGHQSKYLTNRLCPHNLLLNYANTDSPPTLYTSRGTRPTAIVNISL